MNNSIKALAGFGFAIGALGFTSITNAQCLSNSGSISANAADSPTRNAGRLRWALQGATDSGRKLTITGTWEIDKDIKIFLRNDLDVDASGATFKATSDLDGDMFSIDANKVKSDDCGAGTSLADVTWKGGRFEMDKAKVSTVVPYKNLSTRPTGNQATADALSIRGYQTTELFHKLNHVEITDITFYGNDPGNKNSNKAFYEAGGDSAILMVGANSAYISNNRFYGVRDAAIYVTADTPTGNTGGDFFMENNYIERAFDGITSKRGADDVTMHNNECNDVAVCLSIKYQTSGRVANNVTITSNDITKGTRAISLERVDGGRIEGNTIKRIGDKVANLDDAVDGSGTDIQRYSDAYEAISLDGSIDVTIRSNTLSASTTRQSAKTWGIVHRKNDGQVTEDITKTGNTFNSAFDNNTKFHNNQ